MVLVIDRGNTNKGFYTIQFGVDFDILIFDDSIFMTGTEPKTMVEIDRIVTGSVELKFCVLNIKHPLLLDHGEIINNNFFVSGNERKILRNYFALRLIHRRYPIDLYEIGKRLFI